MFAWSWEPGILTGLALQVGAYLACVGPLRRWFPGSARVPRQQVQLFLLGVLVLFIALVSPLGILSDGYLFSAHMLQHLLVTLIAPPLLLLGTPRWLFRPLVQVSIGRAIGRALTNPLVSLLLYNAVFAIWHIPAYYERSLSDPQIHAFQHVLFISTATLMWWPIFSPLDDLPPLADPLKCMYLFVASIPGTILGAIITLTSDVLYPTYARAPRVWGITAGDDQIIAGLSMWIGGALIYLALLTVFFFHWLHDDEFASSQDTRPSVS